jgi:hypothetical protein
MALELGYLSTNLESPPAGGKFHSVACSGAKIHNIIGGNYGLVEYDAAEDVFAKADNQYRFIDKAGLYQPGYRAQLDFFKDEELKEEIRAKLNPETITLGIGGNDADFGGFLKGCLTPGNCSISEHRSYEADGLGLRIASQKNNLVRTYKELKKRAPDARIYVHGYPQFINERKGTLADDYVSSSVCSPNVRLSYQERVMAVAGVAYMNEVVEAAAKEAGVFYVDVENILEGGRLCDPVESEYDILVNGVTAGNDINPLGVCLRRTGCFGNETYHPKSAAQEKYAERIIAATSNLSALMPAAEDTSVPTPPDVFGPLTETYVINTNALAVSSEIAIPSPGEFLSTNESVGGFIINQGGLLPGSLLRVEIRSTPVSLGQFTVGEDGTVNQPVALPEGFEPGSHTVYVYGTSDAGEAIILYEPVQLTTSDDDFDGDGIANDADSCQAVQNAFIDLDKDQIDDACDSEVIVAQNEGNNNVAKGETSPETVAGDNEPDLGSEPGSSQVLGTATTQGVLSQTGSSVGVSMFAGLFVLFVSVKLLRISRGRAQCYRL